MENTYPKKKILYVDDDLQSRLLIKHLLGKEYDITLSSTAEEAIEVLVNCNFDLILLDIRLEGEISGIELLRKIRNMPKFEETPVLAVTAFAFDEDKRYLLSCGFAEYIAKPINLDRFKAIIREYIENESVVS